MDESLRQLEQRARATPDDPEALRALAVLRARAGDARGAWRARATVARLTDGTDDWRALEPPVRAPRAPATPRLVTAEGWAVALLADGVVVQASRSTVSLIDLDGQVRWRRDLEGSAAVACGSDLVVALRERLTLLDGATGAAIAEAPLAIGARPDRPPGYTRRVGVSADRLVVWHWLGAGGGARSVVDAGERFGEVLVHHPLHARRWGAEDRAQVAAGRIVGQAPVGGQQLCVTALDGLEATWATPDELLVRADERGVIARPLRSRRVVERDLRTGSPRWAVELPGQALLAVGPEHVAGCSDRVEVWRRADGAACWTSEPRATPPSEVWVVGSALVWLDADPTLALHAVDLETGAPRWRQDLPAELSAWIRGDGDSVWADLRAGDGVLALTLGLDVWRDDGDVSRVVVVREA